MKYKPEWKGRLKVEAMGGKVQWDGEEIGTVRSIHTPGAKSPGGLTTDQTWSAVPNHGRAVAVFPSMTLAVSFLIEQFQLIPT